MLRSIKIFLYIFLLSSSFTVQASNIDIIEDYLTEQIGYPILEQCKYTYQLSTISESDLIKGINIISKHNSDEYILSVQIGNSSGVTEKKIKAKVLQICNYPVLIKRLHKGEIIQKDDIITVERNFQKLGEIVMNPEDLYGKEARHNILPETLIKFIDIKEQNIIMKNQQINIVYYNNGLSLKIVGTALESGKIGQSIKVRNDRTNATLIGEVIDNNTILIKK